MPEHPYIPYNIIPDISSKGIVGKLNVSEICSLHDEHLVKIRFRNSTLKSGYIDTTSSELKFPRIKKENVLDLIRDK